MSSLDFRKDNRSEKIFAKNISDFTYREYLWGIALRKDFCEKGEVCNVLDHGVDNSGNLILDRLPNYNVDKIYKFADGRKIHVEIKTIPDYCEHWTIKVCALLSCIRQKAFVLIPKSKFYWLFTWKTCEYFYNNFDHKIYPKFSPNDLAVRIHKDWETAWPSRHRHINLEFLENKKIIYKYKWRNRAKEFINKKYHVLFAEK